MKFYYYISPETNVYHNFATESDLHRFVASGVAVLFLWQNDNTIVVGRNQDVYHECMVEEFINSGGFIARRKSGGGAVYHDLGNLNFSILSDVTDKEKCRYQSLVCAILECFDVKSVFNGKNDILVNGKKCSGNAAYISDYILCQHGTLLIDTDFEKMAYFLTPEQSKLERNHVNSIPSRVANLNEFIENVNVDKIAEVFIRVTDASKLEYFPDRENIDKLTDFFRSDTWVYGGKQ